MKKSNVTLADIAKELGVSINTVSHALHDKPDISEATKQRIKDTAQKMGYIANSSARFLRSGKSGSIAILVGDISNPHFSILIKEIEAQLKTRGYTAFVLNTDEDEKTERQAIVAAKSKNVDGLILCPVQKSDKNVRYLMDLGVPFTLIGRRFEALDTNYVVCDDVNGGYLAAEHLILRGHRDLLVINGPSYISSARERLSGIKEAFKRYELDPKLLQVKEFPITVCDSVERFSKVLDQEPGCTAAVCFSDVLALELAYVLRQQGRQIPADFSVVGFDNIMSKFYFPLMLTSVTSSKTKMSAKAVEVLVEQIESRRREIQKIVLPVELKERGSTRTVEKGKQK